MNDDSDELIDAINFIKDNMVTKDEFLDALSETESRLGARIGFKNSEIDKRLQLDARVARIEKHLASPKSSHRI
jgi:hypothetical protein